ncbi:MAG TPA: pilus assembly protein TadG-related protein [Bryobacteraceae bacterium]|nr:pilus assembly protein TadG-related protein [Bryobacteraceae bacterium]
MRTFACFRSGQAALLMALSVTVIFGMLGLAVDLGWAYYRQQAAQAAADAAAVAAVRSALTSTPSGPICGQSGVWCGASSNCPATAPGSPSSSFDSACMLASANGFTTAGVDRVSVQANTTNPVPTVPGVTASYWATVRISERLPALFGMVYGRGGFSPGAVATAAVFVTASPCLLTLQNGSSPGITAAGTAITTHNCDVYVDSSSSTSAITMAGGSISTGTGRTRVVGGVTSSGTTFTPAALTGQPVMADPFASMQPPTVGACTDGGGISFAGGSHTINPGVYCHVISVAGGSLTFNSGLYILKAGISVSGTTVVANGVTLYIKGGGISMAGPTVTLSPPSDGTWAGVAIFEDRADSNPVSLAGATNTVNGLIYTPDASLSVAGGSGSQVSLICKSFVAAGNFSITGGSAQTSLGSSVSMVQ